MNQPTLVAVGLAVAAGLSGCAAQDATPTPHETPASSNVVALSITGHTLQTPDTIDAGWITFRFSNNGDDIHYAHIVRLSDERTVAELIAAYAEAIRTSSPRPKWLTRFGGPGGATPGDTSAVTQYLEPGNYVWLCPVEDRAGTPHFSVGEYKAFVVRAASANAAAQAAPTPDAEIRLLDFTFDIVPPLKAGQHTIRVVNAGSDSHDVGMLRLAPGMTMEALRSVLNPERARRSQPANSDEGPPPDLGTVAGGVAALAPGMQAFFETNLTPGEYVLFWMVTAPDGQSHIEHGMMQQITIQ